MSLILLIDDNPSTRAATTELIQRQGWAVVAAGSLREARKWMLDAGRKVRLPDLCLVELVLRKGNGFTVGSWLAKRWRDQSITVPTVLISDRLQCPDAAWALARGMSGAVSRREGRHGMIRQISEYLQAQPEFASTGNRAKADIGSAPAPSSSTDPSVVVLARLLMASLRQLLGQAMQLDPRRDDSIAEWRQGAIVSLQKLEPCWSFLPVGVSSLPKGLLDNPPAMDARVLCRSLLDVISALASLVDCRQACDWIDPWQRCRGALADQLELSKHAGAENQQSASLSRVVRMVLGLHACGFTGTRGWLLRALNMLYFPAARKASDWQRLHDGLQGAAPFKLFDGAATGTVLQFSAADMSEELRRSVENKLAEAAERPPDHAEQAEYWYKVSALLRMQVDAPELLIIVTDCCYRESALARQRATTDFVDSLRSLQAMLDSAASDVEKIDLALSIVRRSHAATGAELALSQAEQQELASNLYWLPQSRDWATGLCADQADLYPFLEELSRELHTVCEAAERLEITPLGSLSTVMLQLYRALELQPARLQITSLRRPLITAQHHLCYMLDQVAAWQQPDVVGHLVEPLYRILEPDSRDVTRPRASDPAAMTYSVQEPPAREQQGWEALDASNRRLRRLLNSSGETASLKPVLLDLLKAQRDIIKRHLAYQPPG